VIARLERLSEADLPDLATVLCGFSPTVERAAVFAGDAVETRQ